VQKFIVAYILILISLIAFSQKSSWEKCQDCDLGKFYFQKVDPVNYKVSAKVLIKVPIEDILDFVTDVESYDTWVYNTYRSDLIEKRSIVEGINYMLIEAPFPLKDIDVFMHYEIEFDSFGDSFILTQTCIPDYFPRNKKYQRVLRYKAIWKFIKHDDNSTDLLYIVKLGGPKNLPNFILKLFLCTGPVETLINLNDNCSHRVDSQ